MQEHLEKWYAIERTLEEIAQFSQIDKQYLTHGMIVVGNKAIYELQCEVLEKATDTVFAALSRSHPKGIRIVTILVSRVEGTVKRIFQSVEG